MASTKATTLWAIATVRTWMGITDGDVSQDDVLAQLADEASELIERHTKRKFVTRTITEIRDGDGGKYLYLHEYPVVTFTSLTVLRSPTDATPETVATTSYVVAKDRGVVYLHSDSLTVGTGNVTATFTCGYGAQDNTALPQDIVGVGKEIVKLLHVEKTTGAVAASSISVGNQTFVLRPDWPKHIKQTLDGWRRAY